MRVVVNVALSVDGKLSTRNREQVTISGPEDFERVDELRAESDAMLVGVGTVLADDPSLTIDDPARTAVREADDRPRQPARVVADSTARTPTDARVLDETARTYVLVAKSAPEERVESLEAEGATVIAAGEERVDLDTALSSLAEEGIYHVMVEGGGELIFSLFEAGLVDELTMFVGPMVIGGREAPTLADGAGFREAFPELTLVGVERVDDGVLLRWLAGGGDRG